MGNTHTVRFEPVGIEMEANEDETILHAAFRQGIMLMHGCKEGQCSACKSFLLDGEVDLDKYSTTRRPCTAAPRRGPCGRPSPRSSP
jgi:propane monooxygenase reductase subunit